MTELHRSGSPDGIDGLIAEAVGNDGVFTSDDAARWDVSPAALTRAFKKGRINRVYPRVYVVAGTAPTWWTRAPAAAAWSGGALSHRSAGYALGILELPPESTDVVVPTKRKEPPGTRLRCHYSQLLTVPHVTTVRGIRVTAPARTLLDIAGLVPEDVLETALEQALRQGLVSVARLEWQLRTEGRKGRRGTAALRHLLESRDLGPATESALETTVARWFRSTRLPPPQRQHRVLDDGRFVARVDFAYPQAKVGIEAMSYRWHSGRRAWLRDEERRRALRDLGWSIVEVTYEDITQRGSKLEADVAALLGISLF